MADGGTDRGLRDALDRLVVEGIVVSPVRDEIVASWHRSISSGLRPERLDVPYEPAVGAAEQLERAAGQVLAQLGDELAGTRMSLVLTDASAQVVERRVTDRDLVARLDDIMLAPGFVYSEDRAGTNAIGTALRQQGPAVVQGGEHFAEALGTMACAAAPISDVRTGRVVGAVDLTCWAQDASPLMLPLARRAAREIEQRLLDDGSSAERALLEHFLRARRGAKGPLVGLSARTMHTNAAAAGILQSSDHAPLWASVWAAARSGLTSADLTLAGGSVTARYEPVRDGGEVAGFLVRLDQSTGTSSLRGPRRGSGRRRSERATFGWVGLTESERAVADFVSLGMTNREAAARLFLSPHTVDFHLRHIFQKLGISSRVELTRLVVERREHET